MRLDVPISTVAIAGGSEFPILRAGDFVKCMDRCGFWDKIFGTPSLEKGEQMCYDYWCKYQKLYPNFDLFKTNLPLSRCVPIYVYGDEGQHYKKAAVMVIQWQSVIGRGTSLNNPNIHGNLSEKKYFVNQRGMTLATRFLSAVMPKDSCNTLMIFM